MDDTFFYLAFGGAALIMLVCDALLMWKFPRISRRAESQDEDPNLYAVAMRAWETGKPVVGTVDTDGKLTITEVEPSNHIKG